MTYDVLGAGALDYMPCQYGASKLIFRGPKREIRGPYLAFIGGTRTFGKFIEQPFPLKVEHLTGIPSVNLGQMNAGPDVFSKDPAVLEAANRAKVTVLEVLSVTNMSNLNYAVHPRRNDRFLRASRQLRQLYPEVDFAQFNFTQHMLRHLLNVDAERFKLLVRELQRTWLRKMRQLVGRIEGDVVLLRIGGEGRPLGRDNRGMSAATFVTDEMCAAIAKRCQTFVDVPDAAGGPRSTAKGMVFHEMERTAASAVSPPDTHRATAMALLPVVDGLMQKGVMS